MLSTRFLCRSTLLGAALAALLVASDAAPRAGEDSDPEPTPSPDDGASRLEPLRLALESAFLRGNPEALRMYLPRRSRIYVAPDTLEVADGYYGADQIVVILRRLFEGRTALRFSFLPEEADAGARRRLPAYWVYRRAGNKSERHIAFIVAEEGGEWRVREIRQWK